MEPLTNVAELRALLRWHDVREEARMEGFRSFVVHANDAALPPIEVLFDDNVSVLQQLVFGPWHAHYTEWSDERRNVRRAIATARALVSGSRCLIVYKGTGGANGYIGSQILRRSELPRTLPRGFRRLERVAFNTAPERVAVDRSRYHRAKSGMYIEHAWLRRLKEAAAAGAAIDTSLFD
jgi:hypothetical protein